MRRELWCVIVLIIDHAMLNVIVQCVLGLLYANAGEWLMHKYILHALGKKQGSFWAYHLYEHHAVCVRHKMLDSGYQKLSLNPKQGVGRISGACIIPCAAVVNITCIYQHRLCVSCAVLL